MRALTERLSGRRARTAFGGIVLATALLGTLGAAVLFTPAGGAAAAAPTPDDDPTLESLDAFELDNGLRVFLARPRQMALMSEALLVVKAGTDYEPQSPADLAWSSAEALFAGSMGGDETVRHFLARSGISMDFTVGPEVAVFRFSIPTFQTVPFVHFLTALLEREVSETDWEEAVERRRRDLAGEQTDLWQHSTRMLESLAWKGVPPPEGGEPRPAAPPPLDEARRSGFVAAAYAPSRMVFSLWGEFPLEMLHVAIEQQLSRLAAAGDALETASAAALTAQRRPEPVPAEGSATRCFEAAGAYPPALFVGLGARAEDDLTFYGLQVLAQILGASDVSRLHQRMRVEENLTYTVEASCAMTGSKGLTLRVVSQTDQVERAQKVILEEIERLLRQEVAPEELDAARAILRSRLLLDHESLRDQFFRRALRLLSDEPVRDPAAAEKVLAELTPRRLREMARSALRPEDAVTMVVSESSTPLCSQTASPASAAPVAAAASPDAEARGGAR